MGDSNTNYGVKIKSNQISVVLFTCDQNLTTSQFSPIHSPNKKDNGEETKTIYSHYSIEKLSMNGVVQKW